MLVYQTQGICQSSRPARTGLLNSFQAGHSTHRSIFGLSPSSICTPPPPPSDFTNDSMQADLARLREGGGRLTYDKAGANRSTRAADPAASLSDRTPCQLVSFVGRLMSGSVHDPTLLNKHVSLGIRRVRISTVPRPPT